jgi:hypothetical protein
MLLIPDLPPKEIPCPSYIIIIIIIIIYRISSFAEDEEEGEH